VVQPILMVLQPTWSCDEVHKFWCSWRLKQRRQLRHAACLMRAEALCWLGREDQTGWNMMKPYEPDVKPCWTDISVINSNRNLAEPCLPTVHRNLWKDVLMERRSTGSDGRSDCFPIPSENQYAPFHVWKNNTEDTLQEAPCKKT
jgi:hypothetical protein